MKKFDRGSRPNRGGRRFGGDRDSNRRSMHSAVCSECGNDCEVPFKPTGSKPIFCSDCFQGKRDTASNKFGRNDFKKSNFNERKMYTAVCSKCGDSCEIPFKPTEGKPVYCDECFKKKDGASGKGISNFDERFEILSGKLDKILELLTPASKKNVAVKKVKISEPKKLAKKVAIKKKVKRVATKKAVVKKTK